MEAKLPGVLASIASIASIAFLAACSPFVQHGPWVRSGTSGGFMASGSFFREDFESGSHDTGVFVGIDGGVRSGYVPQDTTAVAFSVGAQISLWGLLVVGSLDDPADALQLVSGDIYFTGPRSPKLASSIGAGGSLHHFMPYFQIGSRSPAGDGWYTTQSFLVTNLFGRDFFGPSTFIWLPSYTDVSPGRAGRATHFTIGAGIGRSEGKTIAVFSMAAGMEFFRSDARTR